MALVGLFDPVSPDLENNPSQGVLLPINPNNNNYTDGKSVFVLPNSVLLAHDWWQPWSVQVQYATPGHEAAASGYIATNSTGTVIDLSRNTQIGTYHASQVYDATVQASFKSMIDSLNWTVG